MIVVDTPGFGDSYGRDTQHIARMILSLKEIGYVHSFLLVVSYEEPRINEQLKDTIKLFSQIFGPEFIKNVLLVFTKFRENDD